VHRTGTATPSSHSASISREDATVLFHFQLDTEGFAEFEFDGSVWQLIAGAQFTTGTSGYYDDVW
jgi:hypothetical protein